MTSIDDLARWVPCGIPAAWQSPMPVTAPTTAPSQDRSTSTAPRAAVTPPFTSPPTSTAIEYFGYLVAPTGAHTVAKWSGTSAPPREQCRDAAVANGSETIEM